jgi:hypothetical protein
MSTRSAKAAVIGLDISTESLSGRMVVDAAGLTVDRVAEATELRLVSSQRS